MSVQQRRSSALEESEIFHILGNDRRRAIVQQLAGASEAADVSDVATEIAAAEADSTPVPNNLYKSVYVSLQQTHLPQLEEDEVIEYDSDAKTINPGPNFDDVFTYIEGYGGDRSLAIQLHLALCILGLLVVVLSGTTLPLVQAIDPVLSSVIIMLVVAASSLYVLFE